MSKTDIKTPFWIKGTGWLKASLLEQSMILLDRNNQEVEVLSQFALPNHTETVYNFEVDDFHTYHIGEFGVWVHNDRCCDLSNLKTINTRHYADKVTQKSVAKEKNTVVNRKAVGISADVQAIRDGKANIINNQFHVNGRIYGHHDGTLYPISGTGFYTLNRAEYKVLGVYNQFGNSQKSKQILSNMGIDKTTQNKVLEIFQELNK